MALLRALPTVLVAVLVASACQTTVDVSVAVTDNGSGTVTVTAVLDPAAAEAVGGASGLQVADLDSTGWDVQGPDTGDDGTVTVSAEQDFADSAELSAVLDQVAGEGVFSNADTSVHESFGSTSRSVSLDVAVSGDPAQFSDDALAAVLGGLPLGRTPEELAAEGATAAGAGTLEVSVELADGTSDRSTFDLAGGEPSSGTVAAEAGETRPVVLALSAGAVLLVLLALVLAVLAFRRRR